MFNSRVGPKRVDPSARCGNTGLISLHSRLVKQMEFQGEGLVWTGKWADIEFVDEPNPSSMSPILKADPRAIDNPCPWQAPTQVWSEQNTNTWSDQNQYWVGWGSWAINND